MTHPQSFHKHLQFILKLLVLLRLGNWERKLVKRRNPNHIHPGVGGECACLLKEGPGGQGKEVAMGSLVGKAT
jgi:hypothetical protein